MTFRSHRVDLAKALRLVASDPGGRYGEYVAWFVEAFSASERAAKDAVEVLRSAGYLDRQVDPSDRRCRRYSANQRAQRLLQHPRAGLVLSYAHRLFSTCGSGSGIAAAERRDRLERAEVLLTGTLPLDLSGDLFLTQMSMVKDLPLPAVETDALTAPLQAFAADRRCKVCQSPFRDEIDRRIAAGESQADVRRHVNELLGSDYFTANNISRHIRSHFREHTPELRDALQQRILSQNRQQQATIAYLEQIIQIGFVAIHAGVTQPTARDLLTILESRENRRERSSDTEDEIGTMTWEFSMFIEAVREVAGEELFERVLEGYASRSGEQKLHRDYEARRRLIDPTFSFA